MSSAATTAWLDGIPTTATMPAGLNDRACPIFQLPMHQHSLTHNRNSCYFAACIAFENHGHWDKHCPRADKSVSGTESCLVRTVPTHQNIASRKNSPISAVCNAEQWMRKNRKHGRYRHAAADVIRLFPWVLFSKGLLPTGCHWHAKRRESGQPSKRRYRKEKGPARFAPQEEMDCWVDCCQHLGFRV